MDARDNRCKSAYIKKHGNADCIYCGNNQSIVFHHIHEKGGKPEWRFVLENIVPLCYNRSECKFNHTAIHSDYNLMCEFEAFIHADELKEEFLRGVGTIIN
jgi:hypothetical protein